MSRRALVPGALAVCAAALVAFGCSRSAGKQQQAAWDADIARLTATQDSLRRYASTLIAADPRIQRLPEGDIVLSIPTSFPRSVIVQVFDQVVENVTLKLGGIKARVAKSVKKIVTIGEFVVDVDIQEVVGKLKPQTPVVDFSGNRIKMTLPVELNEGYGKAKIHFQWDGKNVADLTCGDMNVTETVTANVVPSRYVITGTMALALDSSKVVCTPKIPETKVNIKVAPTKQSWARINQILEDKHGVCGFVLDKVNVPQILENIVSSKGFNVRLPLSKIRPFIIPAGVSDSVQVKDRAIAVHAKTNSITIEPDAILYSADVTLK